MPKCSANGNVLSSLFWRIRILSHTYTPPSPQDDEEPVRQPFECPAAAAPGASAAGDTISDRADEPLARAAPG